MKNILIVFIMALVSFSLIGCSNQPNKGIMAGGNQVELRSYQTRAFDSNDKPRMLRAVVATLQDLGFVIDQADEDIGSVTGTKISGYKIRMTVITRARGEKQTAVRANAYYNVSPIEAPGPYQDFFSSLEKALFLTAHQVD